MKVRIFLKFYGFFIFIFFAFNTFSFDNFDKENRDGAIDYDLSLTKDTRIKEYIYNPNDVYLLQLHYGYQSQIEFQKNEIIKTISVGDTYAWKVTPLGNILFINPMEKNMRTNMTIITNKRTYQFDLVSREFDQSSINELVYVIRFYYPKKHH